MREYRVPAIAVIVDGGWSKSLHKVIVVYAHRQTNTTKNHDNMTATKTGMVHRLRRRMTYSYRGSRRRRQSTAYATQHSPVTGTVQYMPTWSRKCQAGGIRYVRLSAPTMHAVKCYWGALEKLVAEKPHYKGKGKVTVAMRKCLATVARCAIKMQSTGSDVKRATELLQQDLRNGPSTAPAFILAVVQTIVRLHVVHRYQTPQTYSYLNMRVHVGRRAPQALTRMDRSAQLLPRRNSSGSHSTTCNACMMITLLYEHSP